MSEDARFEDGDEHPLALKAQDTEDLQVISALVQDAVLPAPEMRFDANARRFAMLINRFRWEDAEKAQRVGRPVERVQAVLVIDDVLHVSSNGIDKRDPDLVLSLLAVRFEPGKDGTGRIEVTFAGDGAIALDVECINVTLKDVTRPYKAPSRKAPSHEV